MTHGGGIRLLRTALEGASIERLRDTTVASDDVLEATAGDSAVRVDRLLTNGGRER